MLVFYIHYLMIIRTSQMNILHISYRVSKSPLKHYKQVLRFFEASTRSYKRH